jgi:hypothetical protein
VMAPVPSEPGTTFSSPADHGTYDRQPRAVLTVTELNRWLALAAAYHGQVPSTLRQRVSRADASMTGCERRLSLIVTRPLTISDTIRVGRPPEELGHFTSSGIPANATPHGVQQGTGSPTSRR